MSSGPRCWCGNRDLRSFSSDYLHCPACETLVLAKMPEPESLLVRDDERNYYGKHYFDEVAASHGLPPLTTRARTDLPERCIYWLRILMRYCLPPARVLELGSAHGGFVAMMRWAGFDAIGLDLSPAIVTDARHRFDIPVLEGPIESQDIPPASLDAIVLMDVLEHLLTPKETLMHCLRLLKPGGLILLQTPQYREGKSLARMECESDPFRQMLTPDQHLYLFGKSSVQQMFRELGVENVKFEPAIFSSYDMSLVASSLPFSELAESDAPVCLERSASGRLILALMDIERDYRDLTIRYKESEADRAARLENVRAMEKLIAEQRADFAARLASQTAETEALTDRYIDLQKHLHERDVRLSDTRAEAQTLRAGIQERDARLHDLAHRTNELLSHLQMRDAEVLDLSIQTRDPNDKVLNRDAQVYDLTSNNRAFNSQITEHAAQIYELTVNRSDLRKGLVERDLRIEELSADNTALRKQTAECDAQIRELTVQIGNLRDRLEEHKTKTDGQESKNAELATLVARRDQTVAFRERRLATSEERLRRLSQSRVFRLMRRARLWAWLDPETDVRAEDHSPASSPLGKALRRVVVDLTPVLPGGGNGGAKVMTLELIRHLGRLAPESEFILLTSEQSHDELATLDAPNVRRLCVNRSAMSASDNLALRARSLLGRFLPENLLNRIAGVYRQASELLPQGNDLTRRLEADLLFCPFTAPFYFDPTIPTVCVVYDLQHRYYPQFFEAAEIQERDRNLSKAVRVATQIVCISDYVRKTLLEHTKARPECVETIHILLPHRLGPTSHSYSERVLKRFELVAQRYLLYPANFWPHKNHELLLTAFKIFLADNPGSDIKLVLTGSPGPRRDFLQDAVARMSLSQAVLLPGYLSEEELSAVLRSSMALIFPSLFEGFGMPLLEGMAAGRPLLCSNTTSLPEVADGAALMFDPRIPAEIAHAIDRLSKDSALRQELSAKGVQRLAAFGGPEEMAARYLKVFRKAMAHPSAWPAGVYGAFADGWLGEQFAIAFGNGGEARPVRLSLALPGWVPTPSLSIRLTVNGAMTENHTLNSGESKVIQCFVGSAAGSIEVHCWPSFSPKVCGLGEDTRRLTCQLNNVEIVGLDGASQPLASHDAF